MTTHSEYLTPLTVKRKRPRLLSDPHSDYAGNASDLLVKPDHQLNDFDFRCLLGPYMPAGTYEESVYFLPLAFDYIRTCESDEDLITSIVWFVSEYSDALKSDRILDPCRKRISELLQWWTSDFVVRHYDRAACKSNGWSFDYADYVTNSITVCCTTDDLTRFSRHADLAIDFYKAMSEALAEPIQAAWFLESWRAQSDLGRKPVHPQVGVLINLQDNLLTAAKTIRSTLAKTEPSPTYWQDLLSGVDGLE